MLNKPFQESRNQSGEKEKGAAAEASGPLQDCIRKSGEIHLSAFFRSCPISFPKALTVLFLFSEL